LNGKFEGIVENSNSFAIDFAVNLLVK